MYTLHMKQTVWGRFWSKVDVKSPDECWEWKRSRFPLGYGQYKLIAGETPWKASRVAWLFTNEHPGKMHVLHKCDNPPCCNPYHLFLGTHQDNMTDMVSKGRSGNKSERRGKATERSRDVSSETHRKITSGQLAEARSRYQSGESLRSIGRDLDVSHSNLSRALRGLTRYSKTE